MKHKKCKNCQMPFIPSYSTAQVVCGYVCGMEYARKLNESKVKKPINKVSKKKSAENKVYSTLRKVFLESKPECQAKLSGCTWQSTDVHHAKGRGKETLNIKTWISVCRSCHTLIEEKPAMAKEKGLSISRLN